jgi:hypothetical protein
MSTKRLVAWAGIAMLVCFGTAMAGTVNVDFSFAGNGSTSSGGSWSWAGGSSTLSASFDTSANLDSSPITSESVDFTTGPGTGGSGTMGNPFTFGPSASNSIQIGGCVSVGGTTTCGVLFTGQFLTAQAAENGSGPTVDFTATDVSGTLNPVLATDLGLSNPDVTGSLAATLDGMISSKGGSGVTGSGDLALVGTGSGIPPVPEPSSLLLIGSGLLAVMKFAKSRRS